MRNNRNVQHVIKEQDKTLDEYDPEKREYNLPSIITTDIGWQLQTGWFQTLSYGTRKADATEYSLIRMKGHMKN